MKTIFTEKQIKTMVMRQHPSYAEMLPHWNFLELCYNGGRTWFRDNIFRYMKEGDVEYNDRLKRAYRFNHTREVADLVNKYLFKAKPSRLTEDASEGVQRFWRESTRYGAGIEPFMRQLSLKSSIFGRIWVVVDNTAKGVKPKNKAEEKAANVRTYAYFVRPQNALDMSFDDEGKLNWILFREVVRDDVDPTQSSGEYLDRYRLWTRDEWFLFERLLRGRKESFRQVDQGVHGLGEVPAFHLDNIDSDDPYVAPALIADIAYLDRAVANYLSNLDAIIQDQTFSQLAMPAQGLLAGENTRDKLIEMGTRRIFLYDGEGGTRPEYLAPDPRQANLIITAIRQIINEIYHTIGLAGERTKQDNSAGIDNSSGVAKAYDFERVNALLAAKADLLDQAESNLVRLVSLWLGEPAPEMDLVHYPDSFDVRGLFEELDIASRLSLVDAPAAMRRQHMQELSEKLFPRQSDRLRSAIESDIKTWPAPILGDVPALGSFAE